MYSIYTCIVYNIKQYIVCNVYLTLLGVCIHDCGMRSIPIIYTCTNPHYYYTYTLASYRVQEVRHKRRRPKCIHLPYMCEHMCIHMVNAIKGQNYDGCKTYSKLYFKNLHYMHRLYTHIHIILC